MGMSETWGSQQFNQIHRDMSHFTYELFTLRRCHDGVNQELIIPLASMGQNLPLSKSIVWIRYKILYTVYTGYDTYGMCIILYI
jgi:hypothetical protein